MDDPRIGRELAGYRIERLLGRGGMSVVYLATDLDLERKVALKLLAPELAQQPGFRERFIRESRLAASLDHPNVVPVYEAGEVEGVLFIAMRYVRGTDLQAVIEQDGALDVARVVGIVGQVAGALDAAHREGLVHRDVKPANVLLAESSDPDTAEHVYLSDFGVTKRRLSAGGLTATGQLVGTVDYVAPEQIKGEAVDGRADVYSLGCMAFECLTGQKPFARDTEVAVLWAQVQTPPPSAIEVRAELPADVDRVLARAIAKSPDERHSTAGAFARDLALAVVPGATPTAPPQARTRAAPRRSRIVVAAAMAIALIAAGVTYALTRTDRPHAPINRSPDVTVGGTTATGSLARIGIEAERVVAGAEIGSGPSGSGGIPSLAVGEGFVWVMTRSGLVKVNSQNAVLGTIDFGTATETVFAKVATGEGAVWVLADPGGADARVIRIDPTTNGIVKEIPLARDGGRSVASGGRSLITTSPLAVGEGAVWVFDDTGGRLLRIDPQSNRMVSRIKLPVISDGVAVGEGSVWVRSNQATAYLIRVEPTTNRVLAEVQLPGGADGLAVGGGSVWVTDSTNDTLIKFDPVSNSISQTIPVGLNPQGVTVDEGGAVWVFNTGDGSVWQVRGNQVVVKIDLPVARVGTSLPRRALAAGFGSIWVF
jgi:YVTN family beta-propeller protein